MRENWRVLRIKLEPDKFWLAPDRLKAVRLLGHQPVDAATDRTIAQIFVASHALIQPEAAFDDLMSDLKESQLNRLRRDVKAQWPELWDPDQKANCREILIDLVDQNIERLNEHLEEFEQNADDEAARSMANSDATTRPQGIASRNFILKCRSGLNRGFSNYRKYQEELKKIGEMMPTRSRGRTDFGELSRDEGRGRTSASSVEARTEDRMPAEVDLSWAYEMSTAADRQAQADRSSDMTSHREAGRIDVMLDTILADGGDDPDDSTTASGQAYEFDASGKGSIPL